jgi:hypothetical protein
MKKLFFLVVLAVLFGCNTEGKNRQAILSNGIELSVEPGDHWLGKMKLFIFSVNKTPQMAAWIEDTQGNYISTITVTIRSAKNNWRSAPKEGRPEALPVWNHKIKNDVDTVSAATSKGTVDVHIDNGLLINGREYTIYLEINHSFDYNETWPEKENDVNGQPSLLYRAQFNRETPGKILLNPIGHGSENGSDETIIPGLEGMTTALTIIKEAYIMIK